VKRRTSRTIIKRLRAENNPKKALKLKEDQGYASVLPVAGTKKQLQKPKDMPNKLKARTA